MNIQSLIPDFTGLQNESKRRFSEIKHSCESSVSILRQYQSKNSIDINNQQKKDLLKPLILACKSGNLKLSTISIPIIHKLILNYLIPIENLTQLLSCFIDASNLSVDIQLRILQCLPSLMQNYNESLNGDLLLDLIHICSNLTSNNKSAVVINTAYATLQQIFNNIYDNISVDASKGNKEIKIDNNEIIQLDTSSYEGFLIFQDLCNLLENEKPIYLKSFHIKILSVLELIENIIHNHKLLFNTHRELSYLLRIKIIPSLLRILNSSHKSFQLINRTIRIINVLITDQLASLQVESEIILSFTNHLLLDNEIDEHQYWEKILVLEMYRNIFSDFSVVKQIFIQFDKNQQKKDVLKEVFLILNSFSNSGSQLTNKIVKPLSKPSQDKELYYLSKSTSYLKPMFLDHLDKSESPVFPSTYSIYLILQILLAFTDEISSFVSQLSDKNQDIEEDIELSNALIESCAVEINLLYEKFIYYSMDDETFHSLIRSVQKYAHITGLLGLTKTRDKILTILSEATIKNDLPETEEESESILKEPKKQILALGESIVDSITTPGSQNTEVELHTRYFNSRHVVCFKALIYLAISLGSTLDDSWSLFWKTFQWCNYYLYGPDQLSQFYNKSRENFDIVKPQITNQELSSIENSMKKLFASINESPKESFINLIQSLMTLSNESFEYNESNDSKISLCQFNKTFYLQTFSIICESNSKRLIEDDDCWSLISSYTISLGCKRKINMNLRVYIVEIFNKIIESIANTGFAKDQTEDVIEKTSDKTLQALNNYLESLFDMGIPQELLVLNWETEIHLSILTTLHTLIDKYDTYYQHSWNKVFKILNTPFKLTTNPNLKDKLQLLIEKSFDTLKLILDEFLLSLPFDQFKYLIDTVIKFCNQELDLNISFSSVSYFWSISDSLKLKVKDSKIVEVKDEPSFIKYIDETNDENYIGLDLYLLLSLAKLSKNEIERAQVRDGSIQTFFQIIDSHGEILSQSWDIIYKIVLSNIFDIIPPTKDKNWLESSQLILNGLVVLYNKYVKKDDDLSDKWYDLINYFRKLVSLKWIDLDIIIFKSLQELLQPPLIREKEIQKSILEFWTSFQIEYDFINENYQDSLTQLMNCFPNIYEMHPNLSVDMTRVVMNSFYQCARYPVLQSNQNDTSKPTKLQTSILYNFEIIKNCDDKIQSVIIQQLSNIILLPFGVRKKIEDKLSKNEVIMKKFKLPSFVSISHLSLLILIEKTKNLHDFTILIEDNGIVRLIKSLIEIIENKFIGLTTKPKPLWIECNDLLLYLITKLNEHSEFLNDEHWNLINQSVELCFHTLEGEHERVNIEQYNNLTKVIIPKLKDETQVAGRFILNIYQNSFFYGFNQFERDIFRIDKFEDISIEEFTTFDFDEYFGSTEPLSIFTNRRIRTHCLRELIKFAKQDDDIHLKLLSEVYLFKRVCFSLRRLISDLKLINGRPLPLVQSNEIEIIMNGLQDFHNVSVKNVNEFKKLQKLIIRLVPNVNKIDFVTVELTKLLELYLKF